MKKIIILFFISICFSSCFGDKNKAKEGSVLTTSSDTNQSFVYKFRDKLFDLDQLKFQDTSSTESSIEIERGDFYLYEFTLDESKINRKAVYKNSIFELKEDGGIHISDINGNLIKIISDSVKKTSFGSEIFSTPVGVVVIVVPEGRFRNPFVYQISVYDEEGVLLNKRTVAATDSGNVIEAGYSYCLAHSEKEIVFSSKNCVENKGTIILNVIDGSIKRLSYPIYGIIIDTKDNSLAGTINFNFNQKTIEVNVGELNWGIKQEWLSEELVVKAFLKDSTLIIARYDEIATGCSVDAYNAHNGELLWKGDVKQLNACHSGYYNVVYLTVYKNKLVLEGNEANGDYLQVLDIKTGKRLFEYMGKEW